MHENSYVASSAATLYYEDFIKHEEATTFEELIQPLGKPVDKKELLMLAQRGFEILRRRQEIVEKAEKIIGTQDS